MYFRTKPKPGFADGCEAQIDITHFDPIRTGSIYDMLRHGPRLQTLVRPDTWFIYELDVRDGQWRGRPVTNIRVAVNGDELYEFLDFNQTFKEGRFAFQQHDPDSKVCIRKVEVLPLSDGKKK